MTAAKREGLQVKAGPSEKVRDGHKKMMKETRSLHGIALTAAEAVCMRDVADDQHPQLSTQANAAILVAKLRCTASEKQENIAKIVYCKMRGKKVVRIMTRIAARNQSTDMAPEEKARV